MGQRVSPVGYFGVGISLLQKCEFASLVRMVLRPIGADGEGVIKPTSTEVLTRLGKEAESVDAVEMLEDEEVDFGGEGEEWCGGLEIEVRVWWAGSNSKLLDWEWFGTNRHESNVLRLLKVLLSCGCESGNK